jgi:hypothetical protein
MAKALPSPGVADFGGTGVSDCAVGNTARDTSGSNPSLSTTHTRDLRRFSVSGNLSDISEAWVLSARGFA